MDITRPTRDQRVEIEKLNLNAFNNTPKIKSDLVTLFSFHILNRLL